MLAFFLDFLVCNCWISALSNSQSFLLFGPPPGYSIRQFTNFFFFYFFFVVLVLFFIHGCVFLIRLFICHLSLHNTSTVILKLMSQCTIEFGDLVLLFIFICSVSISFHGVLLKQKQTNKQMFEQN